MPAESLVEVLKNIPKIPSALIDDTVGDLDDAAVARAPAGRSLVLTIDVVTPIVDDPRAFGVIAATNALSDVYAMGGRPELALSFAGFPTDKLPLEVLGEALAGMADACRRAGCAIVGGHTIADAEPKAGLAVVGSVDPTRVWSQRSARADQAIVLTKRIGTGIVGQAIRAGKASDELVRVAIESMTTLNDVACAVGLEVGATSCTDVTGFGLLGHLRNVVEASSIGATIHASRVPLFAGVRALVDEGVIPGGTKRNLKYASVVTTFADEVDEATRLLLADAQTSGGLLLFVPSERADEAVQRLHARGAAASAIVGETRAASPSIRVEP